MSPRSSLRVDRRRRVLVDESRNDERSGKPRIFRGPSSGSVSRYNSTALQAINAPIASYLPLRPYWLLVWFLVGFIPIMALLLLDVYRHVLSLRVGHDATRALDLTADGSLMGWVSSMVFAGMVLMMLGIYSVRRHRRDDYRGRFTAWRWAMLVAVVASVDASTGLRHVWQGLCQQISESASVANGNLWWIGTWCLLFGGTIVRLSFEMSSSRKAIAWAVFACLSYVWGIAAEVGLIPGASYHVRLSQAAAILVGHHLILFSLLNYARTVVLEATGQIEAPTRARTSKKRSNAAVGKPSKSTTARGSASKSEDKADPPDTAQPRLRAVHVPAADEHDRQDELPRKQSKAERRRLRKEQKRRKAA